VKLTLYIAFVLVVIVIFAFLGRAADTLIPVVALPLSILLTLVCMKLLGYSIDNLSLLALTLAIGFLVDDAIVFLENTVRRMEHGETAMAATFHSAREISFTILSMTLSLAAVFLPLVFMPGLIGRIFNEFAMTIIIAIIASGIVSLTLTPLMTSRLLRNRGPGHKKTWVERVIGGIEHRVLKLYGAVLWWFLRWRFVSLIIWILCMAGTVWFFQAVPKAFLPKGDSGFILGVMIAQEGTSPEQMRKYQTLADHIMQDDPAVETTFTMTGNSQFLASSQGLMLAFLKDADKRDPIDIVAGRLMGKVASHPGVFAFLQPQPVLSISVGATSQLQGQYTYSLSGVDPSEVYAAADRLTAKMMQYPGFLTVRNDYNHQTPQLEINILRDKAAMYGVSTARILALLRAAYSQNYIYLIKKPTDQYQVILEAKDSDRTRPGDLALLYIRSDDNQRLIPLKALATWNETLGLQAVNHINQFTAVNINFNLKPGANIGEATQYIENAAKEVVPATIRGSLQGEAQTFRETIPSLVTLMFFAVFVMYVILGILYESYVHPITVLSTLPVAMLGGLATLYIFNSEASLYAFVGMFMLMGIVKKNGIMIVDFAIQRVAQGERDDIAIHDASMDRFRPIIMTTAAAVMGAVPIAMGIGADPESRRPLGLVIIGGLVFAQFITLFVTPVIYLYLEDFQEHVLDKIPFLRSTRTHKELKEAADRAAAEEEVPREASVP
jgi:HAE1 family hydrophobic/amphiphilic exporter-1